MYMQDKTIYTNLWESDLMKNLYKRFSAIVKPFDIPLLDFIVKKTNEELKDREVISILEIGAGSGQGALYLLNALSEKYYIKYTGIDVSDTQKILFKETSVQFPETATVEEYILSSWQEFDVTKKYDLIVAQHSWYGIGADDANFLKIREALAPGGLCFVILDPKSNISSLAMEANGEHLYSSEDFEQVLMALSFLYEKAMTESDVLHRNDFSKDGILTEFGKDFFSYLYRRELTDEEKEVMTMIERAPEESFRYHIDMFIIKG